MNNTQVEVLNKVSTLCEYIMINGKNSNFRNVNESVNQLLEDVINNFTQSFRTRFAQLGCMTDGDVLAKMDGLLDGWTVQVVLIATDLYRKCETYKKKLTE